MTSGRWDGPIPSVVRQLDTADSQVNEAVNGDEVHAQDRL